METLKLGGQVAIVTGAASGIGRRIAIRFTQEGARVAVVDKNLEGARKVVKEIERQGGEAVAIKTDVTNSSQVISAVDYVINKWGRLNILVNNAGAHGLARLIDKTVKKEWSSAVALYLNGAFFMTEKAAKAMVKNGWQGSIINITSVHSHVPVGNGSYYTAVKAGLAGATKSWALELAPYGIRANAIAPGAIRNTGMNRDITDANDLQKAKELNIPLGRHGLPEEIADAAVFLATNGYITGQEIFVDGGFVLTR
jgi:NAD(P)-dependent dehydrogenase (short-subunit alcohol dehydrogenase family)